MLNQNIGLLPWGVGLILLLCVVAMLLAMVGSYLEDKAEERKDEG